MHSLPGQSDWPNVMVLSPPYTYSEKGHIFCREWIIENLVQQKKEKEKEIEIYERQQQHKEALEAKEKHKEFLGKVDRFEQRETLPTRSTIDIQEQELRELGVENSRLLPHNKIDESERERLKVIEKLKQKVIDPEEKKDWIKTSFWMPECTPQAEKKDVNKPSKYVHLNNEIES